MWERVIERRVYTAMSENIDPQYDVIQKRSVSFVYNKKYFEMGTFLNGPLKGCAVLYCETTAKDVELPPFLEIDREVTQEEKYSTIHIAGVKDGDVAQVYPERKPDAGGAGTRPETPRA